MTREKTEVRNRDCIGRFDRNCPTVKGASFISRSAQAGYRLLWIFGGILQVGKMITFGRGTANLSFAVCDKQI